jgi:hypothetical protein
MERVPTRGAPIGDAPVLIAGGGPAGLALAVCPYGRADFSPDSGLPYTPSPEAAYVD